MDNYGTPARETQITNQIGAQEKYIGEISEIVQQLCARIEVILRPANSVSADGIKQSVQEPLAPLASQLRTHNGKIEHLSSILRDVLSRIEL